MLWFAVQWCPLANQKGFTGQSIEHQKRKKHITCKLFSYPMSASNLHKSHLTFVKRKEKQESILSSGCLSDGLR
jgi:hypothetical protein